MYVTAAACIISRSIEERLYERELQAALELSLSQSDASQEPEPLPQLIDNSGTEAVIGESGDCPAPILDKEEESTDCVIIPDDVAPPSPIVPVLENGKYFCHFHCLEKSEKNRPWPENNKSLNKHQSLKPR